ncbi:unnamed protein product, partial [Heterosigma akashiwo]
TSDSTHPLTDAPPSVLIPLLSDRCTLPRKSPTPGVFRLNPPTPLTSDLATIEIQSLPFSRLMRSHDDWAHGPSAEKLTRRAPRHQSSEAQDSTWGTSFACTA